MTRFILVDGKPIAAVHALDRGLQFGDGLFETMAVVEGQIRFLSAHLARLRRDCTRLLIDIPGDKVLGQELAMAARRLSHGVLKLIVTRGSSGRGYRIPDQPCSRRILIASDWPAIADPVRLTVCATRLAAGGSLAGIKHLNRLEQVMACAEWQQTENVNEGLMLDPDGHVIETTSANVFMVHGAQVSTPSLKRCGVAGIMREQVLDWLGQDGRDCQVGHLSMPDLQTADEVFVTNSVGGIRPVVSLDEQRWQPGEVCLAMQQALIRYDNHGSAAD